MSVMDEGKGGDDEDGAGSVKGPQRADTGPAAQRPLGKGKTSST